MIAWASDVVSELISDLAAAARASIVAKVSELERVSREVQHVGQRVDDCHTRLTGASMMDPSKPGQQPWYYNIINK